MVAGRTRCRRQVRGQCQTVQNVHTAYQGEQVGNAPNPSLPTVASTVSDASPTWVVQAHLNEELNSAVTPAGKTIKATVDEPIYNPDGTVAVPQGATLTGVVTRSKPARRFGRAGALSFNFRHLTLPNGEEQSVQTSLSGADSAANTNLSLSSEGEVKPKPQDKVVVPLILLTLAASPLHEDKEGDTFTGNALASNSLGVIGFVIGAAAQTPNLAAGFGFYGAAVSIYDRWIAKGKQVTLARDTRIVLQTVGRRANPIELVRASRKGVRVRLPVDSVTCELLSRPATRT